MFAEIAQYTAALLGRSTYQSPPPGGTQQTLDSPAVVRMRESMGGQLQLPTLPQTRWYLSQLEAAEYDADSGNLELAGKLMRAARTDGVFGGVLSTRTGGLVRLPKRFRGDAEVVAALELGHGDNSVRSVFDEMFPSQELGLLAADGCTLGVGVGELVDVVGRDYPVFVRLEPQWLLYRWIENRWYFRSAAGLLPITPGDGRWILHTPGGRMSPWVNGIWRAVGRAFIRKEHAALHCDNWEGKLANPARVAVAPQGAAEAQADSWFRAVMAWGVNTTFGMRPGYDVRLLESNGRGWESFKQTIADANTEMIICVAGQTVTTGQEMTGFVNADIHKSIRADLIKQTADDLAYTMNTQGIPSFVARRFGEDAINSKPCVVEWDVTPPRDRAAEAQALTATATALQTLTTALQPYGLEPDVEALCLRFAVPVEAVTKPIAAPVDGAAPADASADATTASTDAEPADKAQLALNGAQVTSLLEVIGQVAADQLPRESALEIIVAAFNLDRATADAMLGEVGRGFVPASAAVDVEPLEPADDDDGELGGDDAMLDDGAELDDDVQEAA